MARRARQNSVMNTPELGCKRGLLACALALAAMACAPTPNTEPRAVLIAQGDYLVNRVAFCGNCHTPRTTTGTPDTTKLLLGAPTGMPAPLAGYAPPLAGNSTGYSEQQFAEILETGRGPGGF